MIRLLWDAWCAWVRTARVKRRRVTTDDDGIRPNGPPDACFYCCRPVGSMHRRDCVTVRGPVRLRLTVEYVEELPVSWTKEQIEYARNEGSWCLDNVVADLADYVEGLGDECLCTTDDMVRIEFVRRLDDE